MSGTDKRTVDSLGNRMKRQYEDRTRYSLPRRTFTVIRLDGKAFHTFTRHMNRPFDDTLNRAMNEAMKGVCHEAQGVKVAYAQSDEINLVLTDFDKIDTEAWFDGNIQKVASVAASACTAFFNRAMFMETGVTSTALFDARTFTIPDPIEVENYLIWRQKDAMKNAIQMIARAFLSHSQLTGKSTKEMVAMLATAKDGVDITQYPLHFRRGRVCYRAEVERGWTVDESPPIFTEDRTYLIAKLQPVSDTVPTD